MATYTVTKVLRRPNTSTEWPGDKYGYTGYNDLRDKVTITSSISADELNRTTRIVWDSKADYLAKITNSGTRDSSFDTAASQDKTYFALNGFECTITEEDGTVRVFNSSNKTFEVQE